jgi:D-arabinose 1-dehydrogenase-like Zn-dependent alcohol dehydrogenase
MTTSRRHPNGIDAILDLVNGPNTIQNDFNVLKKGGKLVSTRYAADQHWFSERGITSLNISSKTNPLASTDGLTRLGEMLANGRISARIHRRAELDDASSILQQLRAGALGGKTVIHIGQESK